MATFTKIPDFVENIAHGVFDLSSDTITAALSVTDPTTETPRPDTSGNGVLANVTEVAYTNLNARTITTSSSAESGGTYTLILADKTLTASGGSVAGFRYIYLYSEEPAAPQDPLIGYYDYGSTLVLADGESLTIDFDGTNGVLTIT